MGNHTSKNEKKDNKANKDKGYKNNTISNSKFHISKYINAYTKELNINDSYLAKNIEKEYSLLESEIQQLCLDKIEEEEETENESLGKFLYILRGITLNALDLANELKKALFEEFIKNRKEFANLKMNDPGCIAEFSSWTKNSLIDKKQFLKNFCEEGKKENYNEEDFNLYLRLTDIYFQCLLSNEIIEFKSLKNNNIDFNNNEMYDLAQIRGNKKKVNFEVLPGLFYNKVFFQKGKIHVFCYIPGKTYMHKVNK